MKRPKLTDKVTEAIALVAAYAAADMAVMGEDESDTKAKLSLGITYINELARWHRIKGKV